MPLIAALLTLATLPFADFSGTYKGKLEGIDFELKFTQTDASLTGKATSSVINFNLSGKVDGDQASGTIQAEGDPEKMYFRATLKGKDLDLRVAEAASMADAESYSFTKVGEEPAKTEGEGKLSKFFKKPIDALATGKEYTHASGGKFRYPAGWSLKEEEIGIVLTPPNFEEGKEFYLISAEPAAGATDPTSKQVSDHLEAAIGMVATGVKRVGKLEPAPAGNAKGAVYTWDANINGQSGRIRAYVTILKGHGVALVAMASKEKIEERDKELRAMFYTFGWGQGKVDQRLVGSWQFYSYKSGRETKASAVLNADGTFSYQSSSEFSANLSGKDSGGNELWTGWVNSRGGSGWKGTWFADGSEITLNFEDGSSESWDYRLEQQGSATVMILVGNDPKKPFEWSKVG